MRASVACATSCLVGLALVVAGATAEASPRPEGEVLSVVTLSESVSDVDLQAMAASRADALTVQLSQVKRVAEQQGRDQAAKRAAEQRFEDEPTKDKPTTDKPSEMNQSEKPSSAETPASAPKKATRRQSRAPISSPWQAGGDTNAVSELSTPGLRCEQRSGDARLQPWPSVVRTRIQEQFGVSSIGGARASNDDHGTGRALDVMVAPGSAKGDRVADWVVANADSLNVKYVIWKQHIWAPYRPYWRGMGDRGSATQNHYDHVHISFKAGSGICPSK